MCVILFRPCLCLLCWCLASCTEGTTVLVPWSETVTDLSPTDGTALVTVRPTLSWKAVDGAIKYYIQLALDDEDLESAPMTEVPGGRLFSP